MASSTWPRDSSERWTRVLALWAGLLTGPLAWSALLQTNYVLSYVACEQRQTWMLYLATAVALVLVAGGAAAAWRAAPALGQEEHEAADPRRAIMLRARFMALGGLAMSAFFAIVILATTVPVLVLHPCTP
jgi:hypothetical protein